jgi:hypothetical protein
MLGGGGEGGGQSSAHANGESNKWGMRPNTHTRDTWSATKGQAVTQHVLLLVRAPWEVLPGNDLGQVPAQGAWAGARATEGTGLRFAAGHQHEHLSHVNVNVNVFSLGLSNATEEHQVYSAIWDMPMLQGVCTSTGCS